MTSATQIAEKLFVALVATLLPSAAFGQQPARHQQILELVDQHAAHFSGRPGPYGSTRNWAIRKRRVRRFCSANCSRRVFVSKQA